MTASYHYVEGTPDVAQLPGINAVVEAALMTWSLPERVKRLALPSYRYTEADLEHLGLATARDAQGGVIAVAAWEPAAPGDGPPGRKALLLHGLYVHPLHQRRGIGTALLRRALQAAAANGSDGLLVKAQHGAEAFFAGAAFTRLETVDGARDYARRYWHPA